MGRHGSRRRRSGTGDGGPDPRPGANSGRDRHRAPHPPLDPQIVPALSAALRAQDVVDAAYVFEGPPEDGVRRLWLGLDIPPPREPAAVEDTLRAGVDALREQLPDIRIEHTIVERDAVLASLRETAPPVYEAAR